MSKVKSYFENLEEMLNEGLNQSVYHGDEFDNWIEKNMPNEMSDEELDKLHDDYVKTKEKVNERMDDVKDSI